MASIVSMLSSLIIFFEKLAWFLLDILEVRRPFRIAITAVTKGAAITPIFTVTLINYTKGMPLNVHRVRVHYGDKFYNHAFVLNPRSTIKISPKEKQSFELPFANGECEIQRSTLHKEPPNTFAGEFPTFGSPADLFKAIATGDKHHSWIEIDFNEFRGRRFRGGKIKKCFAHIISVGKSRFQTF